MDGEPLKPQALGDQPRRLARDRAALTRNLSWLTLTVRWTLGLVLAIGSLADLTDWQFFVQDPSKVTSWLSLDPGQWPGRLLAALFLLSGTALLVGLGTVYASFATLVGILLVHAIALVRDPFYNTLHNSVPIFLMAASAWSLAEENDRYGLERWVKLAGVTWRRRRDSWISLFVRLFVGLIAFRQGVANLLVEGGPVAFAERLYVTPFAGHLPEPLLWLAGISNPILMTACGAAICLGLFTRFAAGLYLAFLVQIVFGHLVGDPYQSSGGLTAYGLNNFAFAAFVYLRSARGQDGFALTRE